jgi:hypothetical protein
MTISSRVKVTPPKPNPRLYRSPDAEIIRVCLGDGRVATVGPEPRTLGLDFHATAVREGCIVSRAPNDEVGAGDVKPSKQAKGGASAGDDSLVERALSTMLEREQPGDFIESSGLPDLAVLSALAGFPVGIEQASRVLRAMQVKFQAAADLAAGDEGEGAGEGEGEGEASDTVGTAAAAVAALRQTADEVDAAEAKRNKRKADVARKARAAKKSGEKPARSAQAA